MCRGFQQSERLKIKAFYVQLSVSCSKNKTHLPDYLTLHYLPRVNASQLEINGSKIRPDSPAFVTLHRVWSNDHRRNGSFLYGSRERVVVCEGVRFEVYVGDVKVLKGIFRKYGEGKNWKMGCKCDDVLDGVKDAEVSVAVEGPVVAVNERVEMVAAGRRRRRMLCELEEIPEESEEGSDVCGCSECCGDDEEMDGGNEEEMGMEMEMDGVNWAVDVGIWVVCLGVGYLVSRTSSKILRRKRFL